MKDFFVIIQDTFFHEFKIVKTKGKSKKSVKDFWAQDFIKFVETDEEYAKVTKTGKL